MGGVASRRKEKNTGNVSDDSDSVIVEAPSAPSKKSEIQEKFGWYDSTDSDISELNYLPRTKKAAKIGTDTSWKTIPNSQIDGSGDKPTPVDKIDEFTEARYSLKDFACECKRSRIPPKDCIRYKGDITKKEKRTPTTTTTSTSYCYCTAHSECYNADTITTTTTTITDTKSTGTCTSTSVSHESTQTESSSPMNIDKKRTQLDRYSREPPERDQNYDSNYMKSSDPRYQFEHNSSCHRYPCKSPVECKGIRPPDYPHSQYQYGPHNMHAHSPHGPHSPHGIHSSHPPHTTHSPHSPHSPHNLHSGHAPSHHVHNQPPPYPNQQYNSPYQDYQQFSGPMQPPQIQQGPQGYSKSNYPPNQVQQRRGPPLPTSFDRKRTTYDLAKSVENLRQLDHTKMSSHPSPSKSMSHSVPEVTKHKSTMKQDTSKSESSDNYGYVDYSTHNKYPYEEPNQDREDGHDRNCACDYCHHMRRNYFRNCSCCECRKPIYEELSSYSEDSQNANQHVKQRNMNLAYQKTDDYPVLVDEIETTISQRNKERVRNTMRQFELLSRQNKALEKPIYDDEEEEDRCNPRHFNRSVSPRYNRNDRCGIQSRNEALATRPAFTATPFPRNKGYVEKVARYMDPALSNNTQKYPKFSGEQSNSHWQMDPRSGEWYKVYEDSNYDFQHNYPPLPDPPAVQYREQEGCQKGPPNPNYYNPPPPVRTGSPTKHHQYSVHSKTCNCRNCAQHRY